MDQGNISSNGLYIGQGGIVDIIASDVLISGTNRANVPNLDTVTGLAAQTGYGSNRGLIRVSADNLQILDGGTINASLLASGQVQI